MTDRLDAPLLPRNAGAITIAQGKQEANHWLPNGISIYTKEAPGHNTHTHTCNRGRGCRDRDQYLYKNFLKQGRISEMLLPGPL